MVPLLLAGLAAAGALGAFFARRWPRTAALDCALALVATTGVALLVPIGPAVPLGEVSVRDNETMRAVVILTAVALATTLVVVALRAPESEPAVVAGAAVAAIALAFSVADASVAVTLAAGAGFLGVAGAAWAWRGAFAQLAPVPGLSLAGVALASALERPPGPVGAAAEVAPETVASYTGAVVIASIAVVALLLRLGVMPLHFFPLRLARGASLAVAPVRASLLPGTFALLMLAWLSTGTLPDTITSTSLGPLLVVVGAGTMLLAVPAMLAQDDLGALITAHAMSDLGLVVVAVGSGVTREPSMVATLGVWLTLAFLARAAVGACVVALAARTGSRRVSGSYGWIRLTPLLLPGWIVAIVAGMGWPGSLIHEARVEVLLTASPGVLGTVLIAASVAAALGYLRLIVTGLWRPADEQRAPARLTARLGQWTAAIIVLGLAALPIAIASGGTRLTSALAGWQPFGP